jgi:hypothetical protein
MQKQNTAETNCNDDKTKIKLIKELCATICDAFGRIEDICTELIEEVIEPSHFGPCEGIGLYLYVKQN